MSALLPFVVLATLLHARPIAPGPPHAESAYGGPATTAVDPRVAMPPADPSVTGPAAPALVPARAVPPAVTVPGSVQSVPIGTTPGPPPATPPTTPPATAPARPRLSRGAAAARPRLVPAVGDPSVVATATVSDVPLYPAPGAAAPSGTLANPDALGAPLTFLVAATQDGWVQAYVPERPNGSSAWIPSADVALTDLDSHIVVDLTTRELTYYVDDAAVWHTAVAPGAPTSPTPTGLFYVTDVIQLTDPQSQYGPYALGLSGFSDTYLHFEGGPGQIAIHGTNQPQTIGSYASNGCVRLNNAAITALAEAVVAGTAVEIGY